MTVLRSYGTGTDGTIPGIGGCPFDMDRLQKDYVDGSITPTKIIHFGATSDGEQLSTGVEIALDQGDVGTTTMNGKQVLDVLACSSYYESSTLNFRVSQLQKPGAARASDVWVAVPNNIVIPALVQKLHQGAIDKITIASLAFLKTDAAGVQKPTIVQTHEYGSCYIKMVDSLSYGFLSVFAFSYAKVRITQLDYDSNSNGGTHIKKGSYVYVYDYNGAAGQSNAGFDAKLG